jgi:hypothetical protein
MKKNSNSKNQQKKARGEVVSEKQPMELFFGRIPVSLVTLELAAGEPVAGEAGA